MSLALAANRLLGALVEHPGEAHRMQPVLDPEAFPPGLARSAYSFMVRRHAQGGPSQPPLEPEELVDALRGAGLNPGAAKEWVLHVVFTERAGPETIGPRAEEVRRLAYGSQLVSALRDSASMAEGSLASGETYAEVRDAALRRLSSTGGAARAVRSSHIAQANDAFLRRAMESKETGGDVGLSWGLPRLDQAIGGMRPGQLTVVGARMKVGKTHLAVHLAERVAGQEWPHLGRPAAVVFFALEMDEAECRQRALAWQTELPADRLGRGDLDPEEWSRVQDAVELSNGYDVRYVTERGLSIEGLVDVVRSRAADGPVDLIVVDYLDLVRRPRSQRDDLEIGRVVRGLLELAGETQAHVLLLAQLNREGSGVPTVQHLAGSDEIARAAHHLVLLEKVEESGSIMRSPFRPRNGTKLRLHLTSRGPGTGEAIDANVDYPTSRFEERSGVLEEVRL